MIFFWKVDTSRQNEKVEFGKQDTELIPHYGYGAIYRRNNNLPFDEDYYPTSNYGAIIFGGKYEDSLIPCSKQGKSVQAIH